MPEPRISGGIVSAMANIITLPANGKDIQVEDGGYTRIHNAILDALSKAQLAPLEFRICYVIMRRTYGYQKKEDVISLSQFEEGTQSSRQAVMAAIKNLLRLKVIDRTPKGQGFIYRFNKYIEQWEPEVFVSRSAGNGYRFHSKKVARQAGDTRQATDTSTRQAGDTETRQAGDTHKRKKESLKKERGETPAVPPPPPPKAEKAPAPKPGKGRDPLLDHPAIVAYRDICRLTPNEVQRQSIAAKVGDVEAWRGVLTEWMECGWRNSNVNGMLDRYSHNGGIRPSTNGSSPTGPHDGGSLPDSF